MKTDGKVVISTGLDNSGMEKDVRKTVAKLADQYKKAGMSQSEAMKKAWSEVERTSAKSTKKIGQHIHKNIFTKGSTALDGLKSALSGLATTLGSVIGFYTLINFGKEAIELGSDLAEVQNVVDVTFGSMSTKVNQFAKDATKSYGLSEKVAKQYMGTFGAMSKAFGYTTSAAYEQAAALTGLTGDVASFYNLSTDEAFTKLKSVYTGETESLKDLGIVMTQTALDEFALQKGMGKTTKSMSEQEKVALRLAFVTERLSGASGDFQRTSDGWANQTRVLSLQLESLKATLGQGFINILTPLIKNLNEVIAKLIIVAQKFRDFTQLVFGNAGSTTSAVTAAADSAGMISSNIDSAASSAKELKKQLAGFDKLNVLGSDSDADGGGVSTTVTSSTTSDNWDTGETVLSMTVEEAEELKEKLKEIAEWVGVIGATFATWKISSKLLGLSGAFSEFFATLATGNGEAIAAAGTALASKFKIAFGAGLMVAGAAIDIKAIVESWVGGVDWNSLWEQVLGAGLLHLGGFLVGGTTGLGIGGIISGILTLIPSVKSAIMECNTEWSNTLSIVMGISAVTGGLSVILGNWIPVAIGGIIVAFTVVINFLRRAIPPLMAWLGEFFEPLITAATAAWNWLDENVFSPIVEAIGYVFGYAYEKYTEIKNGLIAAFSVIWSKVSEIVAKIKEIFLVLAWAFNEYIWTPIKQKVLDFYNEYLAPIVERIRSVIQTIKNFLLEIWYWLKEKIIDKILAWVDILVDKIKSIGTKVVDFLSDTFKSVINGVLWAIENSINVFIRMLNGAIGVINKIPGVNITTVGEIQIPRLAKGAVIPANKEFLAVLGDQKNGRNLELPENLLRQIVREESGGSRNGIPFIIQLVLNGKIIGEEAVEYVNGVIRKTGKSPIKQGG